VGVLFGRHPDKTPEATGEVALIREADLLRYLLKRVPAQKRRFRPPDTDVEQVGVRRQADLLAKSVVQVGAA